MSSYRDAVARDLMGTGGIAMKCQRKAPLRSTPAAKREPADRFEEMLARLPPADQAFWARIVADYFVVLDELATVREIARALDQRLQAASRLLAELPEHLAKTLKIAEALDG